MTTNKMMKTDEEKHICSSEQHEWVAFSTALAEGWVMVQCVKCGAHGTVDDPTTEE